MNHNLVYFGSDILRGSAEEVENIDDDVLSLIDSMFKIMYKNNGVGLAAPQINIPARIIVIDTQEKKSSPVAVINPVIKEASDELCGFEEGCLSVPGIRADITRPAKVLVTGISPDGKEFQAEAEGLLARVFQHETDHLDGKLFIDYLEPYEKNELRHILKKIKKMNK